MYVWLHVVYLTFTVVMSLIIQSVHTFSRSDQASQQDVYTISAIQTVLYMQTFPNYHFIQI